MTNSNLLYVKKNSIKRSSVILMLGNYPFVSGFVGKEEIEETDVTMQKGQKKIIQKNFEVLLEDLDPNPLMNFLYQEDIITRDDIDEMDSIKPRKEKSKALLFTLQRRGPNAFLALVEGLIIKKKQWLATLLLKEGKYN